MDISSLPADYFDTRSFFKDHDKKLKDKGYGVDRYGRPKRKRKLKRNYGSMYILHLSISLLLVAVLVILLILVHFDILRWGKELRCAPGFNIGKCERMDFLDSYVWKGDRSYDVNGESCEYGVAFRIWAPLANRVHIYIDNTTAVAEYNMERQNDGCWFVNVCNIGVGIYYSFSVFPDTSSTSCSKLSLGASSVVNYGNYNQRNQVEAPVSATKNSKMNLNEAVIYQIHLPSFVSREDSEFYFYQLIKKVYYLVSLGINTIQLFPVEQFDCGTWYDDCWNMTSIAYPGILHSHFGTIDTFREMVSVFHREGIQVLLEVNWSFFDTSSVLYDCDCLGKWGSFYNEFPVTEVEEMRKPSFSSLKLTREYVWKILNRWRNEVGIDGIVWQYSNCLFYSGEYCLNEIGTVDHDGYSMIKDFVLESDFVHIGDSSSEYGKVLFNAVYNHNLTRQFQKYLLNDTLSVSTLSHLLQDVQMGKGDHSIYCFETRYTSSDRFITRNASYARIIRLEAIGMALNFLMPVIPCIFMGSEYFSSVSFTETPDSLSWRVLNEFSDEYKLSLMTRDLVKLHKEYLLQSAELDVFWKDEEKGILCYSLTSSSSLILVLINVSNTSLDVENELLIPVPSVPGNTKWVSLFDSESSQYSSLLDNEIETIHLVDCPSGYEGKCITLSLHWLGVRVLLSM